MAIRFSLSGSPDFLVSKMSEKYGATEYRELFMRWMKTINLRVILLRCGIQKVN